jgi:hypothetical protein
MNLQAFSSEENELKKKYYIPVTGEDANALAEIK